MKSKKIISLFLCLVLGVQVLPFRQIAAWLSANQFSEEIPSEIGVVKAKSIGTIKHSDFQNASAFEISPYLKLKKANHHQEESLFMRHPDDVITPPPNFQDHHS